MKNIFILSTMLIISGYIISCSDESKDESSCKNCRIKIYVNNVLDSTSNSAKYCDEELTKIEEQEPTTIGNTTTKWECD
jgi:hypothetical protein